MSIVTPTDGIFTMANNLFTNTSATEDHVSVTNVEYRSDLASKAGDDSEKNTKFLTVTLRDEESLSSSSNSFNYVFSDPKKAEYYRSLYEDAEYECRHLFDLEFTWTEAEEKRVVRKND